MGTRPELGPPRRARAASASAGSARPAAESDLIPALLAWFASARRDLPWRRDRDAYRVWISESMLQQTRVEAVIPYFERFLARFPTVADLAAAPVEDVLAAWSGLGYYRRARALHEAARAVLERHGGAFPSAREDLLALPGVGPYTAGAVASIAFDRPERLVDGNVARVLARLYAIEAPQESAVFRARTWEHAGLLVADLAGRSAGEWNQALMELGALVCVPREPRCLACPVQARCRALERGLTSELPVPKRRPTAIEVELHVAIVRSGDRWLVQQRPATGRMAGLWELPTVEPSGARLLAGPDWPDARGATPAIALGDELGTLSHSITRHRIRVRVFEARWLAGDPEAPLDFASRAQIAELGPTGLTAKILRAPFARATAR
ncbi:MAG: A/G-specific adenine glycosylase [Planctomycetota bacterium]|nr:A/G-specific adenine glycosylase [Planctomycetota bacterium]